MKDAFSRRRFRTRKRECNEPHPQPFKNYLDLERGVFPGPPGSTGYIANTTFFLQSLDEPNPANFVHEPTPGPCRGAERSVGRACPVPIRGGVRCGFMGRNCRG